MANLVPLGTSQTTIFYDVTVTTTPKVMIAIGTAPDAEYEIAVVGSDDATYSLATMNLQDIKDSGVIGVPGTYKIRRIAVSGGTSGLDILG